MLKGENMEQNNEKKLYFKSIKYDLETINYIKFDRIDAGSKVIYMDEYNILEVDNDYFSVVYSRTVGFSPKSIFDLKISYKIKFYFDDKTVKEYCNRLEELKKITEIKATKAIEMCGVISRASLLIADITMQNAGNTIVTPPYYKKG